MERKDVLIRDIRLNELDACAEVIRKSFATVASEFGLTEENCPTNGAFLRTERLKSDWNLGHIMAGCYLDNELIGFAQLSQKDSGVFELGKLAVLPQHRHAGFGAQLLEWARETVQAMGGNKITIGIIEENIVLKHWYQANGFVHTNTQMFSHLPFTVGFMELIVS